jgi:hypothetical protein
MIEIETFLPKALYNYFKTVLGTNNTLNIHNITNHATHSVKSRNMHARATRPYDSK